MKKIFFFLILGLFLGGVVYAKMPGSPLQGKGSEIKESKRENKTIEKRKGLQHKKKGAIPATPAQPSEGRGPATPAIPATPPSKQ